MMPGPEHLQTTLLLLLLGLVPLLVVMVTPFTKISIVLMLLRNALGIQQVPSNLVISGIALAASMIVMAPTISEITAALDLPERLSSNAEPPGVVELYDAIQAPIRSFIASHADGEELAFVADAIRRTDPSSDVGEDDFMLLIPAFLIAEVSEGLQIGFVIYVVFLVIDLVVANILMAMGMMMLPPGTVSVPIKLFVLVTANGLSKLIHGLVVSYMP